MIIEQTNHTHHCPPIRSDLILLLLLLLLLAWLLIVDRL
jgi:hypothetical protein